ncbi:hypothetical protein BLOT_011936 [Blomia tropicalis]|nr:hypothetical protein BLOT_011936 [Blomia tropicalis]
MDEWMHEQVFGIDDVMCYVRTSVSHSTDNLKRKMTGSAERECDKMIKLYDDIVAVQRFTDVAVCSFVRLPVRSFGSR